MQLSEPLSHCTRVKIEILQLVSVVSISQHPLFWKENIFFLVQIVHLSLQCVKPLDHSNVRSQCNSGQCNLFPLYTDLRSELKIQAEQSQSKCFLGSVWLVSFLFSVFLASKAVKQQSYWSCLGPSFLFERISLKLKFTQQTQEIEWERHIALIKAQSTP